MLDLKSALDLFDTGKWVSLAYVTADRKKGTAGQIIRIPRCRKNTRLSGSTSSSGGAASSYAGRPDKNPNHDDHFTRNLLLPNGQIRKFHFRLLFSINGHRIV